MPVRLHGATKNLHKFTKLREQYRDQYLATAQSILDISRLIEGKPKSWSIKPQISENYSNMFVSDQSQLQQREHESHDPLYELLVTKDASNSALAKVRESPFVRSTEMAQVTEAPSIQIDKKRQWFENYRRQRELEREKVQQLFVNSYFEKQEGYDDFKANRLGLQNVRMDALQFFE